MVVARCEHVHESLDNPRGLLVSRVVINPLPPAIVCPLQAIMGGWWQRAGGYPVGRIFGTLIAR